MSGDHNQYQKPGYVDRRQWKYDPLTGEPYPENFIDALRCHTAISEKPEQEPVTCDCDSPAWCKQYKKCHRAMLGFEPYVAPPQREWQGLTEYEVGFLTVFDGLHDVEVPLLANFIRHIEAKLKEKNT